MGIIEQLDPHEKPPDALRSFYKTYQKLKPDDLASNSMIIDLKSIDMSHLPHGLHVVDRLPAQTVQNAFHQFLSTPPSSEIIDTQSAYPIFGHDALPGLRILPGLLSREVQLETLSRLLHRDISNPTHQTNVHLHYHVNYPGSESIPIVDTPVAKSHPTSFFSADPSAQLLPKDPNVHSPISIHDFLQKKLRWATLGGQYDWTRKEYPEGSPPPFPPDIAALVKALFPEMDAQAAICNLYSGGDTLSLHRDVSEVCDRGLASMSIGCDALFVIGLSRDPEVAAGVESESIVLRIRSGDAVFMSGPSRFAWHGVPKVLKGTCPEWLSSWPNGTGFMKNKRVNLNVRQMQE